MTASEVREHCNCRAGPGCSPFRQRPLRHHGRAANDDPDINNWLLVGADALAYAHRLSGQADYLERAARLFRAGSRDPWYEGDANTYSATKETANGVTWGHVFLQEWAERP